MSSLRARLFASFLITIALGMAVAAALTWRAVEQLYLQTQRDNLMAQAERVAKTLPAQGQLARSPITDPPSQAANIVPGINTRVLDADGTLLIDGPLPNADDGLSRLDSYARLSSDDPGTPLLERAEIRSALGGVAGTAVRTSPADPDRQVIYAAAPVRAADGVIRQVVYITTPLPATSALFDTLRNQLIGAGVLALALSGTAGLWLASRLARPMGVLVRAADAVADGDLTRSVPAKSTVRELDALARAFNRMTASLRQNDQARTAFVADVSHELRTPLTVIKGAAETIQDNPDDGAARERFLGAIGTETDRLIGLVNDLLVLTRADSGGLQLMREVVDLYALAQTRVALFQPLALRKRIVLRCEADAGAACIDADAHRLAQVLDNLIDNALRHAPESGNVSVQVRVDGAQVMCEVADDGPGIAPEHLARVFDRFYRADSSRARHTGGNGLGLSIARALIEAHGGEIRAGNAPVRGAVVAFAIPGVDCHQSDTLPPPSRRA